MATKPSGKAPADQPEAEEAEVTFTPAQPLEDAVAGSPAEQSPMPPADEGAHETTTPTRYRVLSGGISTASGARYRDDVLSAAEIGEADRVERLLAKGAIEAVGD